MVDVLEKGLATDEGWLRIWEIENGFNAIY